MAHLERKQLIHRDLAARNVLIGENLIAKVRRVTRFDLSIRVARVARFEKGLVFCRWLISGWRE